MPSTDIPVSEPPRASAVMDAVFRLYRSTFGANLLLAAAMTLAAQAANLYRLEHAGRDAWWWSLAVGGGVLGIACWAALVARQQAAAQGQALSASAALVAAVRALPRLLLLALLAVAVIELFVAWHGPPALLAAALAVLAPWALLLPVIVLLDRQGPFAAAARTWRLLRGRPGLGYVVVALSLAVFLVFYIVCAVLGVMLMQQLVGGALAERVGASYAGLVALALFAPLVTAMTVTLRARL